MTLTLRGLITQSLNEKLTSMCLVANFREGAETFFFLSPVRGMGMLLGSSPGSFPRKDLQVTSSDREALLVTLKRPLPRMMLCGGWGGQEGERESHSRYGIENGPLKIQQRRTLTFVFLHSI